MSQIFGKILELIYKGEVKISSHGFDELLNDDIYISDIMQSLNNSVVIKDYIDYSKGPCVLVLQRDSGGRPVHVLWGVPKGKNSPAVLVTAYRPDPKLWTDDFMRRKK